MAARLSQADAVILVAVVAGDELQKLEKYMAKTVIEGSVKRMIKRGLIIQKGQGLKATAEGEAALKHWAR